MRHQDRYTSPHANTQRPNPTSPPVTRYPERPPFTEQTRPMSRPSVIRNGSSARDKEQKFLQMERQMLKMHGELLKQTGNLMNYHADILGQRIQPAVQPPHYYGGEALEEHVDDTKADANQDNQMNRRKYAFQEASVIKRGDTFSRPEMLSPVNRDPSVHNMDAKVEEAEDVIDSSPWALAMDKYLDKALEIDLDV